MSSVQCSTCYFQQLDAGNPKLPLFTYFPATSCSVGLARPTHCIARRPCYLYSSTCAQGEQSRAKNADFIIWNATEGRINFARETFFSVVRWGSEALLRETSVQAGVYGRREGSEN